MVHAETYCAVALFVAIDVSTEHRYIGEVPRRMKWTAAGVVVRTQHRDGKSGVEATLQRDGPECLNRIGGRSSLSPADYAPICRSRNDYPRVSDQLRCQPHLKPFPDVGNEFTPHATLGRFENPEATAFRRGRVLLVLSQDRTSESLEPLTRTVLRGVRAALVTYIDSRSATGNLTMTVSRVTAGLRSFRSGCQCRVEHADDMFGQLTAGGRRARHRFGHPPPRLVRLATTASHFAPHFAQSHQTFLPLAKATVSGVRSPLRDGCHSSATSGYRSLRLRDLPCLGALRAR